MNTDNLNLADSLFDYPNAAGGWQFRALDKSGTLHGFARLADSAATATPDAFLVCGDRHCRIGRDYVHAGYEMSPCLEWTAADGGTAILEGEAALLRPTATGQFNVSGFVDDRRVLFATIDFGQHLRFSIPVVLARGARVRIVFASLRVIDNNDCLYHVRMRRPAPSEAIPMESIETFRPESWRVLENRLRQLLPMHSLDAHIAELAHDPYRALASQTPLEGALKEDSERNRASREQAFRKPGFFSGKPRSAA